MFLVHKEGQDIPNIQRQVFWSAERQDELKYLTFGSFSNSHVSQYLKYAGYSNSGSIQDFIGLS